MRGGSGRSCSTCSTAASRPGQNVRVFPISNWTELDVWEYIRAEGIALPSLYFAHEREVFDRDGLLWADSPYINKGPGEEPYRAQVRFRTVGDMTCTAAVASGAVTLDSVIAEIALLEGVRARRAHRRQALRGGHGTTQAGRVLLDMDLLRLATAGSVDDGKSTLIGRLLYETGSVPKDRAARRSRPPAAAAAPTASTCRCSPMA